MKRRMIAAVFGCSLSLLLVLCSYGANGQQAPSAAYNGHWWLSISSIEQTGFLNGYLDCYTFEFKGKDRFSNSADTYRYSITEFYEKGQAFELSNSVAHMLHEFRDPQGYVVIDKYAEHAKGPHGGNDGLYWRQISAGAGPELEQRGFVEGYLACHAGLNHDRGGTFSRPPAEYVGLITQWYGFNRETDDIDSKREPTAVADVLFKFRDHLQSVHPGEK